MDTESKNTSAGTQDTTSSTIDQFLRGILVIGILIITPIVVFHFVVPIIVAHPIGIFVAVPLIAMIGVGVYTIAEGDLPSIFKR